MSKIDDIIGQWVREKLLNAPLATDAAAYTQVQEAVAELRKDFAPKSADDAKTAIDAWATAKFSNAPPLTHNTPATNQVNAAIADLKNRLAEVFAAEPTPPPPVVKPVQPGVQAQSKE